MRYNTTIDRIRARLSELSLLAPGWLDGEGEEISNESLTLAGVVIYTMLGKGLDESVRIFPTISGHVQAEIVIGSRGIDIKFHTSMIEVGISDIITGEHAEHFIIAEPFDQRVVEQLKAILKPQEKIDE